MTQYEWTKGQKVVIDRSQIATIDSVTSAGRAKIGTRLFEKSGRQKDAGVRHAKWIKPWTPELQAEMDLAEKGRKLGDEAAQRLNELRNWIGSTFFAWNGAKPTPADVEKVERLVTAIRAVTGDET